MWLWAAAIASPMPAPHGLADTGLADTPVPSRPAAVAAPPVGIYYGELEPDGYPEVVGLGVFGLTVCTGTLITPRLVLTAAHCSVDLPESIVTSLGQAFFGPEPTEAIAVSLDGMWLHPDYVRLSNDPGQSTLGEADVALILLREEAPVAPVWFRTQPFSDSGVIGQRVVSVGFGLAEDGSSSVNRSAPLGLDELDPWFLVSKASTNDNSAAICSGDSGGPQLGVSTEGDLEVWGVHSWGSSSCRGESGSTRLDVVADWVLDTVEEVHGTRDRCEIYDAYLDGACDEDCAQPDPDCQVFGHPGQASQAVPTACQTAPGVGGWLPWMLALGWRRRTG